MEVKLKLKGNSEKISLKKTDERRKSGRLFGETDFHLSQR